MELSSVGKFDKDMAGIDSLSVFSSLQLIDINPVMVIRNRIKTFLKNAVDFRSFIISLFSFKYILGNFLLFLTKKIHLQPKSCLYLPLFDLKVNR